MSTPTPHVLNLLCAGAAQGLVKVLQPTFAEEAGADIAARFGAVGAMREALLGGAACDVFVATDAMVRALGASGALDAATLVSLGRVRTGLAVRDGSAVPAIGSAAELRSALLAADRIYFPDPQRATAGIHFAAVMKQLGLDETLVGRFATFPSGAVAMRELAAAEADRQPIGCTQITEINYTPGVRLVGALPAEFELATTYSAAVCSRAADPALARRFVALLGGPSSQRLRAAGGFEFDASA